MKNATGSVLLDFIEDDERFVEAFLDDDHCQVRLAEGWVTDHPAQYFRGREFVWDDTLVSHPLPELVAKWCHEVKRGLPTIRSRAHKGRNPTDAKIALAEWLHDAAYREPETGGLVCNLCGRINLHATSCPVDTIESWFQGVADDALQTLLDSLDAKERTDA